MGRKYFIASKLNGYCTSSIKSKAPKTIIGLVFWLIVFRAKYPIVDIEIRNGYKSCSYCSGYGLWSCSFDDDVSCIEAVDA